MTDGHEIKDSKHGFTNEEYQESMQGYLIRGADEIRKTLNLTEQRFQLMSRAFNSRGRRHFIYEVLNEVEQLAMALMDFTETLKEKPTRLMNDEIEDRISRNSFEFIEREISLHTRRLIELLVFLINFSQTNSDEYYDHYLLYQELNQRKKKKHECKAYYGSENLNNNAVIDHIMQYITWGEAKIDLSKCWYLAGNNPLPHGKAKLENFDICFRKAIGAASIPERIALRFSYNQAYGEASQSIHFGIGRIKSDISFEGLRRVSTFTLYNLGVHCLLRCQKLLGLKNRKGVIPELIRTNRTAQKELKNLYNNYVKPEIKKGDFVRVDTSLFEVLGTARGEFGYRSFKLRYLTRPHMPEIKVEWYPAYNVIKIQDGKQMRDNIIKRLTIDGEKPIIDPRIVRRSMRETMSKTWVEYIEALENREDRK